MLNDLSMNTNQKLTKVLEKIYRGHLRRPYELRNCDYDLETQVNTYRLPGDLSEKELELFEGSGWLLNRLVCHDHDLCINRMREIAALPVLKGLVTLLFLQALGEGFHRGLTPLLAYYSALNMPSHTWEPFDGSAWGRVYDEDKTPCAMCGLQRFQHDNLSETLLDLAIGRCRISASFDHVTDLEDVLKSSLTVEKSEHAKILFNLLKAVEQAPSGERVFELEKRISALRVLPGSNQASRIWALRSLAELGIITQAVVADYSAAKNFYSFRQRVEWDHAMHSMSPGRADPVWPLSAWRGGCSINWELAREIFPQLQNTQFTSGV